MGNDNRAAILIEVLNLIVVVQTTDIRIREAVVLIGDVCRPQGRIGNTRCCLV